MASSAPAVPMIPWARPDFWGREREYVLEALDSTWISGGPFVSRLEREFRDVCGASHALAVSNGTTAIHLAYLGANLQPGDEVIIPGFCFLAAANVAIHMGATPVFAEVDPDTWCLTAETLERCRTPRTKIAVPVHTYGNVCPMDAIMEWGRAENVTIIEDAAEAFASKYKNRYAGTFGTIGTYSFQATKTISTGEGGMVVTEDAAIAEKMALFRSHGMLQRKYWHHVPGHNFRLTNLQAALGCAQIEQLNQILAARAAVHKQYLDRLSTAGGLSLQYFASDVDPVLWAMAMRLDPEAFPQGRDTVLKQLADAGVEARPGFYAASLLPIYQTPPVPRCEELSRQVVSVPTFPTLTTDQIDHICSTLLDLRR